VPEDQDEHKEYYKKQLHKTNLLYVLYLLKK
jgi:hypothetical protein